MPNQPQKTEHLWYYMKSGMLGETQEGPLAEPAFLELAKTGELEANTKISCPTRTKGQWILAQTIPSLMAKINEGKLNRESENNQLAKEKKAKKTEIAALKSTKKAAAAQQKQANALKKIEETDQRLSAAANPPLQSSPGPAQPAQPVVINNQQTVVIQDRNSNTVPVLLNIFLWPGLGQLVQGRAIAGIFLMGSWFVSLLLCFVLVGFIIAPIVWLIALIDAALYKG